MILANTHERVSNLLGPQWARVKADLPEDRTGHDNYLTIRRGGMEASLLRDEENDHLWHVALSFLTDDIIVGGDDLPYEQAVAMLRNDTLFEELVRLVTTKCEDKG